MARRDGGGVSFPPANPDRARRTLERPRRDPESITASNIALSIENNSYRDATGQLSSQISALQEAVDDLGVRAAVDPAASRAMEQLPSAVRSRVMGEAVPSAAVAPDAQQCVEHARRWLWRYSGTSSA